MWKKWKQRQAQRHREQERAEVRRTFRELRRNDEKFQQAEEPYYIEQLIFERAAILSHCRALLANLRRGGGERP